VLDDQGLIHGMEVSCKASESGRALIWLGVRPVHRPDACLREYYMPDKVAASHDSAEGWITFVWRSINLNTQGKPAFYGSQRLGPGSWIDDRFVATVESRNGGVEGVERWNRSLHRICLRRHRDPLEMDPMVEGVDAE